MKNRIDNILLIRWLENPLSDYSIDELYVLLNTLRSKQSMTLIDSFLKEKWDLSKEGTIEPLVSRDEMFSRIVAEINLKELNEHNSENQKSRVVYLFKRTLVVATRVAAILFIPLVVAFFYVTSKSNLSNVDNISLLSEYSDSVNLNEIVPVVNFYSPPGTRSKILLPDSSEVWLNSNSRISYNYGFGKEERVVSLLGEAFFSVQKNEDMPFRVNVNNMNIKVTGTEFNVSAYNTDRHVETVLIAGEVHLNYLKKGREKSIVMKPSQKAVLDKESSSMVVEPIKTKAYDSWKDGKLVFDNFTLVEVVEILERWFNASIVIKNHKLKSYRFTATLDNRSLDQILMYLSYSSPINYTFENNVVTLTERF